MKFNLSILIVFFVYTANIAAYNPSFTPWDLSSDNKLLLTVKTEQPGWDAFQTAMQAGLDKDGDIDVLTFFPEQTNYYPDTGELEILNRFGLFRGHENENFLFRPLGFYPSFKKGEPIPEGKILPTSASPDGKWVLVQESRGPVRGKLYLYNNNQDNQIAQGRFLISNNHVLEYRSDFALWSPDSQYFLYANKGNLYYMSIDLIENPRKNKIPDESYREMGKGKLANIAWYNANTIYYITDSQVTQIQVSELATRSFYASPLPTGRSIGRIPMGFDSNSDRFWISPDGRSLLVLKSERTLFRFPLGLGNGEQRGKALALPFLLIPNDMKLQQLWWNSYGDITVLAGASQRRFTQSLLYQLDADSRATARFEFRDALNVRRFIPSPDEELIALLDSEGVSIRNARELREIKYLRHKDPRNVVWLDEDKLLIAGGVISEVVRWKSDTRTLISLSKADKIGFDKDGNTVALVDEQYYKWNPELRAWVNITDEPDSTMRTPRLESASYRVYGQVRSSSSYANQIMIRTVNGYGNRSLFEDPPVNRVEFSDKELKKLDVSTDPRVFSHGSRRKREISLVFNASDSDEGLPYVLDVLADYGIRATFFVGGDFIRRNFISTKILAASGHEIGSLFYTNMDMSDYRYSIDKDFIVRGLARNEDEYFSVTNSELSTIWHSPWYIVTPPVLNASKSMNYLYVGRDVDPLDWVTLDNPRGTKDLYKSTLLIVEQTLEKVRPGSIIPIQVGRPGNRDGYLYQMLDILINGLLRDGYNIVPVGVLKEHAKLLY